MTDARAAEAAARELAMGFREGYASAWVMSGALDAYRDAIEARVRAEAYGNGWRAAAEHWHQRDAEVRALVEAVSWLLDEDGCGRINGNGEHIEHACPWAPVKAALKPWSVE